MENLFQQYQQLINVWQKKDDMDLISLSVDKYLEPLKYLFQKDSTAANDKIASLDLENTDPLRKAFVYEARLFQKMTPKITLKMVEQDSLLASEILSLFDNAYFGNLIMGNDYYHKKDLQLAINCFEKMLVITPKSENILCNLFSLCLITNNKKGQMKFCITFKAVSIESMQKSDSFFFNSRSKIPNSVFNAFLKYFLST